MVDRLDEISYTTVTQKENGMRVEVRSLYRVQCTEYERGWGQRDMGVVFFDTEEEAKKYCLEYASGDSECYYRASYEKIA